MLIACPYCESPVSIAGASSGRDFSCPTCGSRFHLTDRLTGDSTSVADPPLQAAATPIVFVGNSSRSRLSRARRKRSSWSGVFAGVISVLVAASSIGSALIIRSTILARDQQQVATVEPRQTVVVPANPVPRSSKVAAPRPTSVKLAVPTDAQLAATKSQLTIDESMTGNALLGVAEKERDPSIRYMYLTMAIEKAIAEKNTRIALRAAESLLATYEVADPADFRERVQFRLRNAIGENTVVDAGATAPESTPQIISRKIEQNSRDTSLAVSLPERSESAPKEFCTMSMMPAEIELVQPVGLAVRFEITRDRDQPIWSVVSSAQEIAKVTYQDHSLSFVWAPKLPDFADSLRNAALQVRCGDSTKFIAMREPEVLPAPTVDLNRTSRSMRINAPLHGLDHRELIVEATSVTGGASVHSVQPTNGRASIGDALRIALWDRPPHAGVQMRMSGTAGQISIRCEPRFIDFDGQEHEWNIQRLARLQTAISKVVRDQERNLPIAARRENEVEAALKHHISRYGDNQGSDIIISERATLKQALLTARQTHAELQASLPINRQRTAALADLIQLSKSIDGLVKVPFRVFYLLGDQEIVIARAE